MNFKPTPLVEASAVLAITILGILITFSITSQSLETGFTMVSNSATIFLLPAFTFLGGYWAFCSQQKPAISHGYQLRCLSAGHSRSEQPIY